MHHGTKSQPSIGNTRRPSWRPLVIAVATLGLCTIGRAAQVTLVNDTWQDGTRTDPAAPVYSEIGTDGDADGLESAWYNGGTGATAVASAGHLLLTPAGSSASWTSYLTPTGSAINLANTGDFVRVTWQFTTGDVNATNGSQNFRAALVDTNDPDRLVADGSPASSTFTGYALFGNMGETTGHGSSFNLKKRSVLTSGDVLGASGNWATSLGNGLGTGAVGYADNTAYSFVMLLTRNAASGLDIVMSMTGGNIGGTGAVSVSVTDASPNAFTFDTFAIRPSNNTTTATFFDTTLFRVEGPEVIVPEPISLAGVGACGLIAMLHRRRKS
jgi:hypothetical protein